MFFKYIIPAAAAIGGAYAQCSVSATTTLTANTDATAIAGCSTFSGSIAIATSGVVGAISLDGMQKLTGSLIGNNIFNVTSISASTLTEIDGSFNLTGGTNLAALNFPVLATVNTLSFTSLGLTYQNSGFGNLTKATNLAITDTFLQSLSGITLASTAQNIAIANNQYLTDIAIDLISVSGQLLVTNNGLSSSSGASTSFPDLVTAGNINIYNTSSLSLPVLSNLTGQLYVDGNKFTTLSLPNLTSSNGLTITNNNAMTNFTLPIYTTDTGALSVQNNTALTGNISFPALTSVSGAANIIGSFSGLSIPKLNTIQGAMVINSTSDISSTCSIFNAYSGNVVHGTVTCNSGSSKSSSSGSSTSSSSSSSSTATKSSSASLEYAPSAASSFTVFGVLAAFFALLM